jgi:hypothetical protein
MDIIAQFEDVCKRLFIKSRNDPALMPDLIELQGLVGLLNTEMADKMPAINPFTPVVGNAGLFIEKVDQRINPIVVRGLGDSILRFIKDGKTYEQIAFELDLTIASVREFVQTYNTSSPKERVELRKDSIFNITEQLENYLVLVMESINDLKVQNPDVAQRYLDSYLKGIRFASEISEKIRQTQERENFKEAVKEILDAAVPGTRKQLEDALRRNRDSLNIFQSPRD